MAALSDVVVPDIGDFTDVPITEVLVEVGQTVATDDPLVEIESDKATMEVPAPFAGTIAEVLVGTGDTVSQGTLIVRLQTGEDGANGAGGGGADDADVDTGEGDPEGQTAPATNEGASAATLVDAVVDEAQSVIDAPADPAPQPPDAPAAPVHASPVARRMARDLGVDLGAVDGSGRNGRVTKDDVRRAAAAPAPAAAPERAPAAPAPARAATPADRPGERVALSRIQRISAERLSEAWRTIPHVTHHEDADVTELEAFRKQLNAEQKDVKVTMVALLLKACASALDAFPRFASSLDGDELVLHGARHLGFAADTPNGLVVPVVRDVDAKGVLTLAGELTELSSAARAGKLGPAQMSGAVFTISSLGGIGGTGFTPIVNPPQVAILGVSRTATSPVWDGERFAPRLLLPLSLSYDHRVIDGAAAARFCAHLAGLLADLRRALL